MGQAVASPGPRTLSCVAAETDAPKSDLVPAIESLDPGLLPHSDGLRHGWRDLGGMWLKRWAEALERDVGLASAALERASAVGASEDGATEVEHALWRVDAAYEKLRDVIALGLGVPSLQLNKDRKGVRRFESDRGDVRKKLRSLTDEHPTAGALLEIDEGLHNHRFRELRHASTHSLAPILSWESLVWFELGEIDERGGVVAYSSHHLTPSESLQGASIPPDQMFSRAVSDGREAVGLLASGIDALAQLLRAVGQLPPPQELWRVRQTGEIFVDREEAATAAREASGESLPPSG